MVDELTSRYPGNIESCIPNLLQSLSPEQVEARRSGSGGNHPFAQTRRGDQFAFEAICVADFLRPGQCREELSESSLAERGTSSLPPAPFRPVLPSQRNGVDTFLVSATLTRLRSKPSCQCSPTIPRLQDETARVEDQLVRPEAVKALLSCFISAKTNTFENLLDPLLKIFRSSSKIAMAIAKPEFFRRLIERLQNAGKAIVRLNLLRILRFVCDAHPDQALVVKKYGMWDVVERLSQKDPAVMVRELAREILPSLSSGSPPPLTESTLAPKAGAVPKRRRVRRTASEVSFGSLGLSTTSSNNGSLSGHLGIGLPARLTTNSRGVPLRSKADTTWLPQPPNTAV